MLPDLSRFPVVAVDVETTGLQWWLHSIFGVSFAWANGEGDIQSMYLDVRNPESMRYVREQVPKIRHAVGHNFKFDIHHLREMGVILNPGRVSCTMIREALINEHQKSYSLDAIAQSRLGLSKDDTLWPEMSAIFGGKPTKADQIGRLHEAPFRLVEKYARKDAELALEIWLAQADDIERQDLGKLVDIEHRLLEVVVDMEHRGVRVDIERAQKSSADLAKIVIDSQKELDKLAGFSVNVNSNPQVQKIIKPTKWDDGNWRAKDGTVLEETEGGGPSVRTHNLHNMQFREAELIATIRGAIKAKDVFIDKYVLGMHHNGYVHASINQTKTEFDAGTITGRFSVTEPALQQIHARDKRLAEIVRSLFLADPGQKWGSYDYSQIDFRCFAHYVKDPAMLDQYALDPGVDFHKLVANLVGVPRNRDEKTGGANAKQINLAMVFGMGQGALAREMGLPYTLDKRGYYKAGEEAQAVFDKYHKTIPGVQQLRDQVEAVAKKRGYILTPLGRKLRFPDGEGAHKAAGLLFQGAAADIIKYKMIEMYDMFKGTDSRLMLTVHDECCVSMGSFANDAHILELLQRFDGDITPMKFRVPIMCKSGIGEDWFDASKKD